VKSDGWDNAIGIGGGILGAGFGLATLNPKGKKVEFIHQRNLLRDIWREKLESPNFPPFIWYMYTEKKFSNRRTFHYRKYENKDGFIISLMIVKRRPISQLFSVTADFTEQMICITAQPCLIRCNRQQER
jgi:hypothetical protein